MEPLQTVFEDRVFRYTQLHREGNLAIYEQRHKEGNVVRFEVIRIRVAPAHTWPDGRQSPEREIYPHANGWGKIGWTCLNRQEADALFAQLQATPTADSDEETAEQEEG